ncbi:MAG: ferric reductase-like transmembrane domain-containing protein [Desulfobaccales bacterium]
MLTTSKTRQRMFPIFIVVGTTLAIWILSKWHYEDWFVNPYKYVAKTASLSATILMCCCIILSTRWRFLERYFGGLDKVYQVHKRLGKWSFFLIPLHPIFLAVDRLPDIPAFLLAMWLVNPEGDRYLWGQNLGVAVFLGFAALMALTLWVKIAYHRWKRTHEFLGLVLLLVVAHIFVVNADVAAYPVLAGWLYALMTLAFFCFLYIRFLYRKWGPRFHYSVAEIERIGDILEVTFSPQDQKMDFRPGQFVYLVVRQEGITPEPHPYSIACGYNLEAKLKLGIKQLGDHTRSLDRLTPGDPVTFYGPYGHFSDAFLRADRDCVFIGAGIGITPFIGMWHVALHSEEQYGLTQVSEAIRELHPEILRTWKSPKVSLFYVCRTFEEASFDNDIRHEVIQSLFHGFPHFEKRGYHYELYLSSKQGRISADYIDRQTPGGVKGRYVFLCGPSPMVDELIRQFRAMGLENQQIIVEDFNLL